MTRQSGAAHTTTAAWTWPSAPTEQSRPATRRSGRRTVPFSTTRDDNQVWRRAASIDGRSKGWRRRTFTRPAASSPRQLEHAGDHGADRDVGRRCARGDADDRGSPPGSQPSRLDDRRLPDRLVSDARAGEQAVRTIDVEGRHLALGEFGEMPRVRRVEAADHEQDVERLADEALERVLPVLGRGADGVERAEARRARALAVAVDERLPDAARDLEGLAREHRRLVRDADPLEIAVGVEVLRRGPREPGLEGGAVAAAADVVGHDARLGEVEHDEVTPVVREPDAGDRRARLLVIPLAVDQRSEAVPRVPLHALPDVQDRAAGRVDEDRAARVEPVEVAASARRRPAAAPRRPRARRRASRSRGRRRNGCPCLAGGR